MITSAISHATFRASSHATFRGSLGEGSDGEWIDRLAALSGSAPPRGAVLLAEVEGDPVAAIGIFDGRAVSNPAHASLALRLRLHLLRLEIRLIVAVYGI